MPIVTGQERKVGGGPAELSKQARERAQKAIDAELNKLQEPNLTPDCEKPPRPEGCSDPKWSTTQRRWVCHSDTDRRWQVWDENEWRDFKDWDKCQQSPPELSRRNTDTSRSFRCTYSLRSCEASREAQDFLGNFQVNVWKMKSDLASWGLPKERPCSTRRRLYRSRDFPYQMEDL
jgi:hypothetical protein